MFPSSITEKRISWFTQETQAPDTQLKDNNMKDTQLALTVSLALNLSILSSELIPDIKNTCYMSFRKIDVFGYTMNCKNQDCCFQHQPEFLSFYIRLEDELKNLDFHRLLHLFLKLVSMCSYLCYCQQQPEIEKMQWQIVCSLKWNVDSLRFVTLPLYITV